MRASKFTEFVALVGLVVGCVIMMNARGGLFYLGLILGVGSVVWYASRGMYLKGWAGPSQEDLKARIAATDAALKSLEAFADAPEKRQERDRLDAQRQELWRQLSDHERPQAH